MFEDLQQKKLKVCRSLVEKTASKDLVWKPTSDEDVFQTRIGKNIIQFYASQSPKLASDVAYNIKILSDVGVIVDQFNDEDLEATDEFNPYQGMKAMMRYLQNVESGTEGALDDILAELEEG